MVKQKKRTRITQSGKNCAIQGARLIWKRKILFVLTKPYCLLANQNPEFRCLICAGITLFALYYTWTSLLSANQNRAIFSCILLFQINLAESIIFHGKRLPPATSWQNSGHNWFLHPFNWSKTYLPPVWWSFSSFVRKYILQKLLSLISYCDMRVHCFK